MNIPAPLLRVFRRKSRVPYNVDDENIVFAFPSEVELAARTSGPAQLRGARSAPRAPRIGRGSVAVLAVCAAALAGVAMYSTASSVDQVGSLRMESDPDGAIVTIDGRDRGTTPLVLTLPSGPHAATVRLGDRRRTLTVDVATKETVVHHIELPSPQPAATMTTGSLAIVGDSRARISVDGVERGQSPLTLTGLATGAHEIAVTAGESTYRSTVTVTAGGTTSFVVAATSAGANLSGWITARTRVPLQILEQGRIVGTTEADRILLPVGNHDLEFVNDGLGFRTTRRVTVAAGKPTDVALALPQAALQVNAIPWAEVWIDGTRIGETPLANLPQTIGPHEVVFKHPQLGERKVTAIVTVTGPSRATVDMRMP